MSVSHSSFPGIVVPPSDHCIRVRAVDTTTRMVCDANAFVQPVLKNHTKLNFPTLCFLLERQVEGDTRYVLYDLGARKDYWNSSPISKAMIGKHVPGLEVDKGVQDILVESGVPLEKIDAIVWSHWHWDHIGDASKFPKSVDLVVGPGFSKSFLPGWPENPNSPILSEDIAGRKVQEVDMTLNIGGFPAHDYFGDGSFYILDVPGHAVGHICGLVRTTPTSFVFLGGDCCHFAGAFRPSPTYPMPKSLSGAGLDRYFPRPCPCSTFTSMHPIAKGEKAARKTPFYQVSRAAGSAYASGDEAQRSIDTLQLFDADPNIFILLAHDSVLFNVLPLLNEGSGRDVNDWKERGWKAQTHWGFLNELPRRNHPGKKPLVDGLRRDRRLIFYGDDGEFHNYIDLRRGIEKPRCQHLENAFVRRNVGSNI